MKVKQQAYCLSFQTNSFDGERTASLFLLVKFKNSSILLNSCVITDHIQAVSSYFGMLV